MNKPPVKLQMAYDTIAKMEGQIQRYEALLNEVLNEVPHGWGESFSRSDLANDIRLAIGKQSNYSGQAHCPHCGICHTSDETCVEAQARVAA